MVNYECKRCGYSTKQKCNFITHLNRKNKCHPILENISIEKMFEMYNFTKYIKNSTQIALFDTQTAPFSTQIQKNEKSKQHPNSTQIAPKQHPNSTQIAPKIIKCDFCEKTFTRKTGLTKHLKCCKIKQNFDNEKNDENEKKFEKNMKNEKNNDSEKDITEIDKLKKEQDKLKDQVEDLLIELSKKTATINNITHNTTNNLNKIINISINNYGSENVDYLKKEYLDNLLTGAFTAIPKLIESIHFNPHHPENHNIKITNKKEPYIKVRKNDKWELQDKKETLETLVDDKYYILEEHYSEMDTSLSDHAKNVMDKFRNKFTDDKELHKDIEKKSEMIILNNS